MNVTSRLPDPFLDPCSLLSIIPTASTESHLVSFFLLSKTTHSSIMLRTATICMHRHPIFSRSNHTADQ